MIAVMIVVVVIPVAIRAPAVSVFVPPPVRVRPAVLPRLVQLLACVRGLPALPPVAFHRLVEPVIGFCDAPLAGPFVGANSRRTDESENSRQHRGCEWGPYP